jgi:hypothetical protein
MAEPELTPKETRVTRGTKAEGEVSFQSSENAYTAPKITPETARNYFEQNIHLATQIVNLLPQVFPGRRTSTSRTAISSASTTSRDGSPRAPRASESTRA